MKVENPLDGWPSTKPIDGGNGFRVNAKHLTPRRLKLTDFLLCVVLLGGLSTLLWALFGDSNIDPGESTLFLIVGWIICALALVVLRIPIGRFLFGKTTVIEFQPDILRIKGLMGFKNYDRRLPHEFTVEHHEYAEHEAKREAKAQVKAQMDGKRELPEKTPYFRDSVVVVFRYAGKRVDIATVTGKKHAEALLVRLQLLDQIMDAARGEIGGGAVSDPETQYGDRPEAG